MKVFQSSSFSKKVKKFKKNEKKQLDTAVIEIIKTPSIGVEKKGDLRGIFVHKFKIQKTLYLLSYRIVEQNLELIMIGAHENYYKDLKSYLKNR
ncbi:MAG: type II toxin-antitoxin system RelE/ParE family toxin [Desulfobulbaceae bacterium]|nr:type II toxin-antitoxin system RelE/ParE family toxin [Desulfobulbaceae bacterium]